MWRDNLRVRFDSARVNLLRWWQYRKLNGVCERIDAVHAELRWLEREQRFAQRRVIRAEALCTQPYIGVI